MSSGCLTQIAASLDEVKSDLKDGSRSSSNQRKAGSGKIALTDKNHRRLLQDMMGLEMPVLEEGNMKRFHDSFVKYYPMLLSFKEKFGHFRIPGEDPKNEFPGLQGWLKNTRSAMSKYEKNNEGRFADEPQYYQLLVAAGVRVRGSTPSL